MDRLRANDPIEKEMAQERKEERKQQAELSKQEAREHNAAAKAGHASGTGTGGGSYSHSTTGAVGQQMSALPGHGSGEPTGSVVEGAVETHPIARSSGTGHNPSHNTRVEGTGGSTYGTGGSYT